MSSNDSTHEPFGTDSIESNESNESNAIPTMPTKDTEVDSSQVLIDVPDSEDRPSANEEEPAPYAAPRVTTEILEPLRQKVTACDDELLRTELHVKARRGRYREIGLMVDEARANRDAIIRSRDLLQSWLDERSRSLSIRLVNHIDDEPATLSQTPNEVNVLTGAERLVKSFAKG